ncbi:hypothetical protein MHH52_14695 [Paenibacillus sp. FSL K6-0276]|uniref:hypothetical protein n=1 Tax=Paenibacillus sp. FSL K6-0276 TaxID=2921450 RepID=UPI0030EC37A9
MSDKKSITSALIFVFISFNSKISRFDAVFKVDDPFEKQADSLDELILEQIHIGNIFDN